MNVFLIIIIPMIIATLTGCSGSYNLPGVDMIISKVQSVTNAELSDDILAEVVESNNQFAFDMYKQLVSGSESNLVFSPLSISQTWAMVWEGAVGETADEIAETLHFASHEPEDVHKAFNRINHSLRQIDRQKDVTLSVDNSIWVNKNEDYVQEYLDAIKRWYNSGLHGVDFVNNPEEAREAMNLWIKEKTGGLFENALDRDAITHLTVLVLINAMYFYGDWEFPFNPKRTKDAEFYLLDGSTTLVPMMTGSSFEAKWFKEHPYGPFPGESNSDYSNSTNGIKTRYTAVELSYKGQMASMLLIMPEEGSLAEFESEMTSDLLHDAALKMKESKIALYMPRFTIKEKNQLKSDFRIMGIRKAFGGADFTGIKPEGGIWVSEFVHGAYIDVDEKGTEAAAFSAAITMRAMTSLIINTIRLDRPFIFFIRDNETGTILFMGRVVDPSI